MDKIGLYTNRVSDCWLVEALASKEIDVVLIGESESMIQSIKERIHRILDRKIDKWLITAAEKKLILSRIIFQNQAETINRLDLFIDAANGSVAERKERVKQLDQLLPSSTIIGVHASACSITELQEADYYPKRIIGLHFIRNGVEVIPGNKTSHHTLQAIADLSKRLKIVLINEMESPGNVVQRLELTFLNEAFDIISEGVTGPHELDLLIKARFNIKNGPFEAADRIGLDVILNDLDELYKVTKHKKFLASTYLRKLVAEGRTGVQTGEGVFRYTSDGQYISDEQEVM